MAAHYQSKDPYTESPLPPPKGIIKPANHYKKVLQADPCAFCGDPGGTVDHIKARGPAKGSNHWTNLTGACLACNADKGGDTLLGFLLRRSGLVGDIGHLKKRPTDFAKQNARKRRFAAGAARVGRKSRRANRIPVYW